MNLILISEFRYTHLCIQDFPHMYHGDILYPVFYVHTTYHAAYPPNPINFMKLQSYHANLIL